MRAIVSKASPCAASRTASANDRALRRHSLRRFKDAAPRATHSGLSTAPALRLTAHRDLTLDVRHIPFWHRLDAILRAFDGLEPGGALVLHVDIDPWPLRTYLEATRAVPFDWQYLESGPATWRVRLRREG
jgi:uncharacterized protein (DUF2249 family)